MRIFFICAFCCPLEPSNCFSWIFRLAKKTFKLNNTHLVHGRCITESGCSFVPLYRFQWIFASSTTFIVPHFTTDSSAISRLSMPKFRSRLIKRESFLGIHFKAKCSSSITVGHVTHRVWAPSTDKFFENLMCFEQVLFSVLVFGLLIDSSIIH